jgi:hypothetical protein
MTENKGSFIIMVATGINQKCGLFEDGLLCRIKCVEMSNEVKPEANVST